MGLPNYKEEQLKKMPLMEFIVRKSKDGKFIVHKTIITDIKPIAYYEKVLSNEATAENEELVSSEVEA
jgi:hypothetical protein